MQRSYSCMCIQRNRNQFVEGTSCFHANWSSIHNRQDVESTQLQTKAWRNVVDKHQEIVSSLLKKKPCNLWHGWTRRHHAQWHKPSTERQIVHDLMYMWSLKKKAEIMEVESWVVLQEACGGEGVGKCWSRWTGGIHFEISCTAGWLYCVFPNN